MTKLLEHSPADQIADRSELGRRIERFQSIAPTAAVLLALIGIAAVAVGPTWPPLFETWHVMPDYSHGMLLAPFLLAWIAARCTTLPAPRSRPTLASIGVTLATLGVWLVAYRASSSIGEQLIAPLVLWSAVWTAFGLPIAVRVAVPIACLYFAIPIWEFVVPWLQHAAVFVAETVLGWVGIPVHIDGLLVSIPEGTFEIAEGCAGRRYFVVCLTTAALLAGTMRMRPLRAALYLAISGFLAIVMNWIRILTVIYAGHITNMQSYLVAREHLSFGWALFAVLIAIVSWIGSRLAGQMPSHSAAISRDFEGSAGPRELANARALLLRPAIPITVILLSIPLLGTWYSRSAFATPPPAASRTAALNLPVASGRWRGPMSSSSDWSPRYVGTSATRRGVYISAGNEVSVFVAEYTSQVRGAKVESSANALFDPKWMTLRTGSLVGSTARAPLNKVKVIWVRAPSGALWLVSYVYRIDRILTSSPITEQLAYGLLSWTRDVRPRIVAVGARCDSDCNAAERRVADFWGELGPQLTGN